MICRKLMYVQGCLKREQDRVKQLLLERDSTIQKQSAYLETSGKKSLKRDTNNSKIERLSTTCTVTQVLPHSEDVKELENGTKSVNGGSTTSLDRHRPGASRLHGSFRQYKKDREKSRLLQQQSSLQTSNSNMSLDLNTPIKGDSKDESSYQNEKSYLNGSSTDSSPTTLPRQQVIHRPIHHPPLRQTRSCSGVTDAPLSLDIKTLTSTEQNNSLRSLSPGKVSLSVLDKGTYNSSTFPRKGILKATSSYNGCSPVTISMNNTNNTILENISQIENDPVVDKRNEFNTTRSIIESLKKAELDDKLVISTENLPMIQEINKKSIQDKSTLITIGKGEKSDSGRESDECPSSTADNSQSSTSDDGFSWKSLPISENKQTRSVTTSELSKESSLKPENPVGNAQRHRYKHRSSLTGSCSSSNSSFDATYDSGLSLSKDSTSSTSDSSISDQCKLSPKGTNNTNLMVKNTNASESRIRSNFNRDTDVFNISNSIRKKKPMPPPRSSMTRLTTVKSKASSYSIDAEKSSDIGKQPKCLENSDNIVAKRILNISNLINKPKVLSPPDPLRSLKQSHLHCTKLQLNPKDNHLPNEMKEENKPVQTTSSQCEITVQNNDVNLKQEYSDETAVTKSSISQPDVHAVSSLPLDNQNKNNELNPGTKVVPKSILHTNSHDDAAQALDLLIHTNTINEFNLSSRKSSKRVKFHPEVKLGKDKEIVIDAADIKNKPKLTKDDHESNVIDTKTEDDCIIATDALKKYNNPKKKEDITYYEPYV